MRFEAACNYVRGLQGDLPASSGSGDVSTDLAHASAVPTIVFHGDQDTIVHPRNGDHFIAQKRIAKLQKKVHRGQVPGGHSYTRTIHTDASGRAVFEHWDIHGAGHAWSGGSPVGSYTDPQGPDAAREMLVSRSAWRKTPLNSRGYDKVSNDGKPRARQAKHQWYPRVKTPNIYRLGKEYSLSRVQGNEIDRLLALIEVKDDLRRLVESSFAGFSRVERRRRLIERCDADMFVCLKNIFSSEKFDDIILREYAELALRVREVYQTIAALESSGVHVHRQLVIRLLGIPAMAIGSVLADLADIIHEETVNAREGIYAWRGRHKVIMDIVAEHKYYDSYKRFDLFMKVIDAISPTYDIEIRTIRELCSTEFGIPKIADKEEQNKLLRKMISVAPGERVPRHRLIRNLIELGQFERAETEIRLFRNDFGLDGPAVRYQIDLATARAVRSPGLLHEDRVVLLAKAREIAESAVSRYQMNKAIIVAYCELGIETARLTGKSEVFDRAIVELKKAEDRIGDPDISRIVARFERRMRRIPTVEEEEEEEEVILDV